MFTAFAFLRSLSTDSSLATRDSVTSIRLFRYVIQLVLMLSKGELLLERSGHPLETILLLHSILLFLHMAIRFLIINLDSVSIIG